MKKATPVLQFFGILKSRADTCYCSSLEPAVYHPPLSSQPPEMRSSD